MSKTWEGRGDRLADARMSWISGRAADDLRITGLHWRLLAHVGRQNHRRGWLRLSQTELAEQWQCARQRLNMAIRDLVEWRYLDKRDQVATGESFCTYRVRLDDEDEPQGGVSPTGDTPRHEGAGGECHVQETPPSQGGVSPTGDRGVTSRMTPVSPTGDTPSIYRPTNADIAELSPPTPTAPADSGRGRLRILDELKAEGQPEHVVDGLIGTMMRAGLSIPKRWAEPIGPLRQMCADHKRERRAVLEHVANALLAVRKVELPSVADVREAVDRSRKSQVSTLGDGEVAITARDHPDQWAAWWAWADGQPSSNRQAQTIRKVMQVAGQVIVPSAFPPATHVVEPDKGAA